MCYIVFISYSLHWRYIKIARFCKRLLCFVLSGIIFCSMNKITRHIKQYITETVVSTLLMASREDSVTKETFRARDKVECCGISLSDGIDLLW